MSKSIVCMIAVMMLMVNIAQCQGIDGKRHLVSYEPTVSFGPFFSKLMAMGKGQRLWEIKHSFCYNFILTKRLGVGLSADLSSSEFTYYSRDPNAFTTSATSDYKSFGIGADVKYYFAKMGAINPIGSFLGFKLLKRTSTLRSTMVDRVVDDSYLGNAEQLSFSMSFGKYEAMGGYLLMGVELFSDFQVSKMKVDLSGTEVDFNPNSSDIEGALKNLDLRRNLFGIRLVILTNL